MREPEKITLLVVDDEEDLRNAIAFDFQRKKYRVLTASNGAEAIKLVSSQKIDMVISDIRMAGGNGIELLKAIKEKEAQLPVLLFLTGHGDLSVEEAYHRGAEGIFSKPFDRKLLHQAVERALTPAPQCWNDVTLTEATRVIERNFSSFTNALKDKHLILGRGGMFLAWEECPPKIGEQVSFKLNFGEEKPIQQFSGLGITRWVRPKGEIPNGSDLQAGLGIEFQSLDEATSEQCLLTPVTIPFIPSH